MAKITKITHWDRARDKKYDSHVEFKAENLDGSSIRYSGGHKNKFFVRVPTEFIMAVKDKRWEKVYTDAKIAGKLHPVIFGDTLEDAQNSWREFMEVACTESATEEKIILYRLKQWLPGEDDNGFQHREVGNGTNKISLELEYHVLSKKKWGDEIQYLVADRDGALEQFFSRWQTANVGNNLEKFEWIELKWTKENEQFFKDTYQAYEALMKRIEEAIGTKKAIHQLIENKTKLLSA